MGGGVGRAHLPRKLREKRGGEGVPCINVCPVLSTGKSFGGFETGGEHWIFLSVLADFSTKKVHAQVWTGGGGWSDPPLPREGPPAQNQLSLDTPCLPLGGKQLAKQWLCQSPWSAPAEKIRSAGPVIGSPFAAVEGEMLSTHAPLSKSCHFHLLSASLLGTCFSGGGAVPR